MATTTVRIHRRTRDALSRLAKQRGVSTADLLAELVERRLQDELLAEMNASFARLRDDRDAWDAELGERRGWETTLTDGLDAL